MCLFTSARTVAMVFARSAGSEAMYCAGVLTFDGGFMDSSSSRAKCITEGLKTSQRQGLVMIGVASGEQRIEEKADPSPPFATIFMPAWRRKRDRVRDDKAPT